MRPLSLYLAAVAIEVEVVALCKNWMQRMNLWDSATSDPLHWGEQLGLSCGSGSRTDAGWGLWGRDG